MSKAVTDESTARQLLLRLEQEWEWPSPALLQEIIACGEAAIGPIQALLTPELMRRSHSDERASAVAYYGLGVLGSLHTPAVIPVLIGLLPQVDDDTLDWMADWILPLGPDAIDPLLAVATDAAARLYPRVQASELAIDLAYADPLRRTQVADTLRPMVKDYLAQFETLTDDQHELLSFFAGDLVSLADPEARPLIEQALAEDKIDTDHFDQEYLEETYAQGGQEPYMKPSPWLDRYREDYGKHQAATMFEALEAEPVQEPVVLGKRLGRNDPCWCGSGKKYKKCHLTEDEKNGRDGRE